MATPIDLTGQFMASLISTMTRLSVMYKDCPKTIKHVAELLSHKDEARTRERSVKMWHKTMQPFYVDIAQTKDEERRNRAMEKALASNWFFVQMDMLEKWQHPTFDRSREKFVHAIRVLNGLAFMQNSFLGKFIEAMTGVLEKLGLDRGVDSGKEGSVPGTLNPEAIMDILPQLLDIINPDTLIEINRMLPHVTYVLGGKDKLLGMLDEALGTKGAMRPLLMQLLGAVLPVMGEAGLGGGDAGEKAEDEAGAGAGAATASSAGTAGTPAGTGSQEAFVERTTSTIRDLIERIADPDNEDPLGETMGQFGLDMSKLREGEAGAGGGEGGEDGGGSSRKSTLDVEEIKRAFEMFKDQLGGEGTLGLLTSALTEKLQSGEGLSGGIEEMSALAAEALQMNGVELGEDQLQAVRSFTSAISAITGEAVGSGEEGAAAADGEEVAAQTAEPVDQDAFV
jgi:hypothetical protein